MLAFQKEQISPIYYRRHRIHLIRVGTKMGIFMAVFGILGGINLFSFLRGKGDATSAGIAAAIFLAIFLYLAWATYRSIRDQFRVRLVPYFERRLGTVDTWLAGENLLEYSRHLDDMALQLGVRPLSEFASGDDMIWGESLQWFSPEEALKTVERLLQSDAPPSLPPSVMSDLSRIQGALGTARSKGIRFCFLLREGSSTSGLEMERRKGSFF